MPKLTPNTVTLAPPVCAALYGFKNETAGASNEKMLSEVPRTPETSATTVFFTTPCSCASSEIAATVVADVHDVVVNLFACLCAYMRE